MIIDFSQKLLNMDDEPMKRGEEDSCLSDICSDALLSIDPKDVRGVDGKEKVVRYELAKRIYKGGEIDLTTDEISKIKNLIGKLFFPIVVGQAFAMLENKHEAPKEISSEAENKEVVKDERISKD